MSAVPCRGMKAGEGKRYEKTSVGAPGEDEDEDETEAAAELNNEEEELAHCSAAAAASAIWTPDTEMPLRVGHTEEKA